MAVVFLSYDRDDAERARHFARALEKAGHQVWWDLHVRGGAQFSKVIEQALKAADVIVVLWSVNSVESAWVRDEAVTGRDTGRLVPVSIDGTEAPLGFRQFQAIDLSSWRGRGKPRQLSALLSDIDATAASHRREGEEPKRPPEPAQPEREQAAPRRTSILGPAAAGLALAAAIGGYWTWHARNGRSPATVAVAAADSSPTSRRYAEDLLTQLGQVHSDQSALQLISGSSHEHANLLFQVSGSQEANQAVSNLVLLDGRTGGLFWSKRFEVPLQQIGDLRQQVDYTAAQVLQCAIDAHPLGKSALAAGILKIYLNACASSAQTAFADAPELVPQFRRVVEAAPGFEPGWAKLLLAEADALEEDRPETARNLRHDIAAARKTNPNLPEAYLAEADLVPLTPAVWGQKFSLIDRAVAAAPERSTPLIYRSASLFGIGRINEALDDARRAATLDPISPETESNYIFSLMNSGRIQAALDEIARMERTWPGSSALTDAKFAVHLRYGDPQVALQMIDAGEVSANWAGARSFLKARITHKPADIEAAIRDAHIGYPARREILQHLVQTLSIFGREDELFSLLMTAPLDYSIWASDLTFRPAGREFWHNPRSLQYAKRIGLLQYWNASGKWPHFCSEGDLKYDCKREAAKLGF